MNKENLVNYVKKNKVAIIIGSIVVIGGYWFTHTNFSYHLEDRTGKYILNPEYKEFHKYELVDLKTVYPTKLAYDPAWFKLPPEKYIPKEQPIPREISNISDPVIRRQAYFNFLCKTESVFYKEDINYKNEGGILDLNEFHFFHKITNYNEKNNHSLNYETNSNPFISPIYNIPYQPLKEGDTYDFFYKNITENPVSNWNANNNSFKEILSLTGEVYEVRYDKINSKFLPLKKVFQSTAKYYGIDKYIEREEMKNLGIYGFEGIVYDKNNNKVVNYAKLFFMGSFLPWKEDNSISNFSWKKINSCGTKPKIISNF